MNRIQKKCLVISSAVHALLVFVLLFGSALMPSPEEPTAHILHVYDSTKVSDAASSGGEPDAVVAPAAPAPPAPPAPKAEPDVAPQPPKPVVEPPKPVVEPPKPKPVVVPPRPITRVEPLKPTPKPEPVKPVEEPTHWWSMSKPKSQKTAKEEEPTPPPKHKIKIDQSDMALHKGTRDPNDANTKAAHERASKEIGKSLTKLSKDLSTGTTVATPGVGGGGESVANFRDIFMSKYFNAWSPPADLDDNVPVVTARVTISRDGSVVSAHIITPSGNRSMDRSIENALETVTFIAPFPASWKEAERTVIVSFDLHLKRQNG